MQLVPEYAVDDGPAPPYDWASDEPMAAGPPPLIGKVTNCMFMSFSKGTMLTVDCPGQAISFPEGTRVRITVEAVTP